MKHSCFPIILLFISIVSLANAPERMSYQAVIRNSSGELVKNSTVSIQISILHGSASGIVVYCETQNAATNTNGLVTLAIGEGKVVSGDLNNIVWSEGPFYIKTKTDIKGGSNYTITGVSELMSVPFSFHATTADSLTKPVVEKDPVFEKSVAQGIAATDTANWNRKLNAYTESDPVYEISVARGISPADTASWNRKLTSETDPIFSVWDKSTGVLISESQITDLKHFTNNNETDPVFGKSVAKSISIADTTRWNSKSSFSGNYNDLSNKPTNVSNFNNDAGYQKVADDGDTDPQNEIQFIYRSGDGIGISNGGWVSIAQTETDPVFSAWDKHTGISVTESQISNLKHFTNADEKDPKYATDSSFVKTSVRSWNSSLAKTIDAADTTRWGTAETDPVFSTWDKSSGISITESQISNLKHFTNADEEDPKYATDSSFIKTGVRSWNSSLAKTIDAADTTRWGTAETDPVFSTWDKSSGISITESQISNLIHFTNADEEDPKYAADSSFIKTGVRSWNSSLAKNITATDTAYWNSKTTCISDLDGDTKIETEQTTDEDIIRMKVAGNERMSLNNSTGTVLQLPTSDDNSSMKVKSSNGDVVFGVDGRGLMNGDGSGLSNVKPLIAYAGGNSDVVITSYNPYDPTLVKYVEIDVPGPGIILTQATGYIQWKSTNDDYCRMSIISNDVAINTANFGSNYFNNLGLSGDHNLADSIDEYNNFSHSRVFTVSTAGTYRYNLWADKGYSRCYIQIGDASMQAIYFPTGGTGALTLKSASVSAKETKNSDSEYDPTIPRNLDGTVKTKNSNNKKPDATLNLSASNEILLEKRLAQQQEEIDSLKKTVNQLLKRVERKSN
jgi:hypothetical protein